jgi:ectoine hydroxylase-related dioxygenase (phytanoyl-CoA dioxygenase family)
LCSFDERIDRLQEFMKDDAVFDGIRIRVVEMTGEPGDVWLTHPLMLHAAAKNCAEAPRLVLSSIVHRSEVSLSEIYQSSGTAETRSRQMSI